MRILVVGPTEPDSFADNVADTLDRMGHEVLRAGPARGIKGPRKSRSALHLAADQFASLGERFQAGVVTQARGFRPDLMITLDVRLRPATVQALRSTVTTSVLWFPDHVTNLGKHEAFLAGYDRIYLKNPPLVDQLSRIYGLPVSYLPEAANDAWHRPVGDYGREATIVVAGNIHPTRALLLERLLDAGVPLTLHGSALSSWMDFPRLREIHSGRSVVREEKARTFRSARAVLNNLHPAEYGGSNCRLFEAAASGAVVLTEWREGMGSLFDRGTEVLDYASFEELVTHCQRLLESPAAGRPIADAAAVRALAEHTYGNRLNTMFADLHLA